MIVREVATVEVRDPHPVDPGNVPPQEDLTVSRTRIEEGRASVGAGVPRIEGIRAIARLAPGEEKKEREASRDACEIPHRARPRGGGSVRGAIASLGDSP